MLLPRRGDQLGLAHWMSMFGLHESILAVNTTVTYVSLKILRDSQRFVCMCVGDGGWTKAAPAIGLFRIEPRLQSTQNADTVCVCVRACVGTLHSSRFWTPACHPMHFIIKIKKSVRLEHYLLLEQNPFRDAVFPSPKTSPLS